MQPFSDALRMLSTAGMLKAADGRDPAEAKGQRTADNLPLDVRRDLSQRSGQVVTDFDIGEGVKMRTLFYFDGKGLHFRHCGAAIEDPPVEVAPVAARRDGHPAEWDLTEMKGPCSCVGTWCRPDC